MSAQTAVYTGGFSSARAQSQNTLLLPEGDLEVGGELTFLTSGISLGRDRAIAFTDVGLLLLNSRYSFGPVELAAAVELLLKQPSYTDEWVPQAGSLTGLVALGEGQALGLHLSGGPLLGDQGIWEGAELALRAKRVVDETLVFEGSLGGAFTSLDFAPDRAQRFWFGEVVTSLQTTLRTPRRAFAMWIGAELRFPVAHNPDADDPDPAGFLDPQTRLNFYAAGAYSFVDSWDLYARFAVIDRGDRDEPETMLPILDGGFDQQQITLGVVHRWELGGKELQRAARMDRRLNPSDGRMDTP